MYWRTSRLMGSWVHYVTGNPTPCPRAPRERKEEGKVERTY